MPLPKYASAITKVNPQSRWPTNYTVDPSGCWLFDGQRDYNSGYARAKHDGVMQYAHRLMYRLHRGEIPAGLTLDHVDCIALHCVNPWHMEIVTNAENARRMRVKAVERRAGLCARGLHDMAANRKVRRNGSSICRPCYNDYQRAWRAARRNA